MAAIAFATWAVALGAAVQADTPRHAPSWKDVAAWPDLTGGQWTIKGSLVNTVFFKDLPFKAGIQGQPTPTGDDADSCRPRGLPTMIGGEFFFAKDSILLVVDFSYLMFRRIYMDGREHGDPDPTYFGHSVGHWEGRTLVVDTVGFLPEVDLGGVPGNGATHIVERFESVDRNTIRYALTMENPEILTRPYTMAKTLVRLPDLEVREGFCQQNDRNAPVGGKANTDLTPPAALK